MPEYGFFLNRVFPIRIESRILSRKKECQRKPALWHILRSKRDKVFKSGLSKFCERQPLKNLKGHGLLKQTISL